MPVPQAKKIKRLLVICGPTATGKTSLALELAKKFKGELISADSRQIYRGFDIGTGKEWGKGVKIWGYDLVGPKDEFSVSDYIRFADKALAGIWSKGKLAIVVGGTGLYIKAMVDGIPTAFIPKNPELRKNLSEKSVDELFESLAQLDALKAASMNTSDRKNPRRLIRAIEVAQWNLSGIKPKIQVAKPDSILFIGLTAPQDKLFSVIGKRVEKRLREGLLREIKALLRSGVSWDDQAMTSLGYRQWKKYFEKKEALEDATNNWLREEQKYAKRQVTWFKRDKRIQWFDITQREFNENVEKLVKKWYKSR